jgi:two-component system response regulator ResD
MGVTTSKEGPVAAANASTRVCRLFRVLVVDDNAADRELAAATLGRVWPFDHRMAVECAADGQAALEMIRRMPVTLLLLDWHMPGMDGRALLRQIRALGFRLPVVVVSGQAREELNEDLGYLGAAYLCKSDLSPTNLHAAVAEALLLAGRLAPVRFQDVAVAVAAISPPAAAATSR